MLSLKITSALSALPALAACALALTTPASAQTEPLVECHAKALTISFYSDYFPALDEFLDQTPSEVRLVSADEYQPSSFYMSKRKSLREPGKTAIAVSGLFAVSGADRDAELYYIVSNLDSQSKKPFDKLVEQIKSSDKPCIESTDGALRFCLIKNYFQPGQSDLRVSWTGKHCAQ